MADTAFYYGFEYLGVGERLVQTPLTDRCYLTLTQALHLRMGGNPFGPAGTGKTESVKALGAQLGRFVLVFNCDESFDYSAMGRIFAGLCQVGAWGCFDEFNRLEERILSAVSQQILTIQQGLQQRLSDIELMGRPVKLHPTVGIFVTMNPGYAGRSNLPDNLKQLFRAVAMTTPDRKLIAQVMLFSQGITCAEELAGKIVLLFQMCEEQLSRQQHYDFGLRALKSVLAGAGDLKRAALVAMPEPPTGAGMEPVEREVLIRSTNNTVVPKLVSEDIALYENLLTAVFPGIEVPPTDENELVTAVREVCGRLHVVPGEGWQDKVLQLRQVCQLRHGIMLVGPSGSGKTTAWRTLLLAMEQIDGVRGEAYVIDPKAVTKDTLYGTLDPTTLEWTDGVFTSILRGILNNLRGEKERRHWVVFDGDVDPEWAENLNSVLDDNKLLTLPSGERLEIPANMKIFMEVDSLKYTTLATVSRCGMVWFSDTTVTLPMALKHLYLDLASRPVTGFDDEPETATSQAAAAAAGGGGGGGAANGLLASPGKLPSDGGELDDDDAIPPPQRQFLAALEPHLLGADSGSQIGASTGMVEPLVALAMAAAMASTTHVMEPTRDRLLETLRSLLRRGISLVQEYNESHLDFPMGAEHMANFADRWLLHSLVWAFGGSMTWQGREELGHFIVSHSNVTLPPDTNVIDMQVKVDDGEFEPWAVSVPRREIDSSQVTASDVVIPTTDTLRHVEVIQSWLSSHKPLILCGPPGSGKTMTLTSTLQAMPQLVLAPLNFSSGTTPELLLKTFAQYCEVAKTPKGWVMRPNPSLGVGKWLVVFCDEINLPEEDKFGTQRVISFMRQMTEQGGYWRPDCTWVSLSRIQFVGACNPPTDPGRVPLSNRFMRHAPLLLVDYPAPESLKQIYGTLNRAMLKMHPPLTAYLDSLTDAMIDFYGKNQNRFTADTAPQYIYSPRELSRWVRAMYEAMEPLEAMTPTEMVRLWAHEGMRLFSDRLITAEEKAWCDAALDETAEGHFHGVDVGEAMARPILFSKWIAKQYSSVDREALRKFMTARLTSFYEEELDVALVVFDEVLDHVLRIDSVLRNPMGHLLLVGESGAGKTVLTRFVSWINGLAVFQIKASRRYTLEDFDEDLREVMKRAGVEGEKVCFIFDESNALSSAFLERMNALLASGEVPGLFEGDERAALMTSCRDAARAAGVMIDSEDELFRLFTKAVQRNLHVVFTMNPASGGFEGRSSTSPALFNRCVVDWFGTWSQKTLAQVAYEFTMNIDTGSEEYVPASGSGDLLAVAEVVEAREGGGQVTLRQALVAALVHMHNSVKAVTERLAKRALARNFLSPRDFLDLIKKFVAIAAEKRGQLEEQQRHLNIGLDKLNETQTSVAELRASLTVKEADLGEKNTTANTKLQQMVANQNEAEKRRSDAQALGEDLDNQDAEIAVRRESAESELSEAEPALQLAMNAVDSIKKPQLDEVRAMARPPKLVQTTLEAVATMIGFQSTEWAEIRKYIRKDDFIPTVVNFKSASLKQKTIKLIRDKYLSDPAITVDAVYKASKACGPLFQWCASQIQYCEILHKIEPLRQEVEALQAESDQLRAQKTELDDQITYLEANIEQYKADYAVSIREIETIKSEMESVKTKVSRAESLLVSLGQEQERWDTASKGFVEQMGTLVGDCLLAAGFTTYAGMFDHRTRKGLMDEWRALAVDLNIPHRGELSMVEYLSRANQRLAWQSQSLPTDNLCVENAIVLERFQRFPLMIDPSGQATKFVAEKYKALKIQQTSFLDTAFMKTLASAIRFGTPLLVHDVENLDPVLNPVLNRELQKTGGRTLIRLGNEDIDYSPKFVIILVTRNPAAAFPPDLCSRVTMVNFTVTPASLESQALAQILLAEHPDVEQRRTDVLRLQGEQNVKVRELEESLLDELSKVEGNILDDDTVIQALERLKGEAAAVSKDIDKTEEVMREVRAVTDVYQPLAHACSTTYFAMEQLADVHFLYQFTIHFFLKVLGRVLDGDGKTEETKTAAKSTSTGERLGAVTDAFFAAVAKRVSRGLLWEDKLTFALRLVQIRLSQGGAAQVPTDQEFDALLSNSTAAKLANPAQTMVNSPLLACGVALTEPQLRAIATVALMPSCTGLAHNAAEGDAAAAWASFLASPSAENEVPLYWIGTAEGGPGGVRAAFLGLLVVKALRPDRLVAAMEAYVTTVLGPQFPWRGQQELSAVVEEDSEAAVPLLLCSAPGHDASGQVDALAAVVNRKVASVAMGSSEGYDLADSMISTNAKSGGWVLLRNIHLCPDWLNTLEKRIHGLTAHPQFRLFLSADIHPKLPTALLRTSDMIITDTPTGVKASMQHFLATIPTTRMEKAPGQRRRLYLLLAWLHAVVMERLRYAPIGWSKRYEFAETDAACTLSVLDHWLESVAGNRQQVDPEQIPWAALRVMLSQSTYGARIDNAFDQKVLDSFVETIYVPESFDIGFKPAPSAPEFPEATSMEGLVQWVAELPDSNPPTWLGLPATAEARLLTDQGRRVAEKLGLLQEGGLDDTQPSPMDAGAAGADAASAEAKQGKLAALAIKVDGWLASLPVDAGAAAAASAEAAGASGALGRCIGRERAKGCGLLERVRRDLTDVAGFCRGAVKPTNDLRGLVGDISRGRTPVAWKRAYVTPSGFGVDAWLPDFVRRMGQILALSTSSEEWWLGGLFSPESWITASRQHTAQETQVPLDELVLTVSRTGAGLAVKGSGVQFKVKGLQIEGAAWKPAGLALADAIKAPLPTVLLSWERRTEDAGMAPNLEIMVPLYLNESRADLLCKVDLTREEGTKAPAFYQRGIGLVAWDAVA